MSDVKTFTISSNKDDIEITIKVPSDTVEWEDTHEGQVEQFWEIIAESETFMDLEDGSAEVFIE